MEELDRILLDGSNQEASKRLEDIINSLENEQNEK